MIPTYPAAVAPNPPTFVPRSNVFEYDDPRNEASMLEKYTHLTRQAGLEVSGIGDIPKSPTRVLVEGQPWLLYKLSSQDTKVIPDSAFEKLEKAERAGIIFGSYVWADELVERPNFVRQAQVAPRRIDPILWGIVHTAPGRGIWVKIAAWYH